MIFAASVNSRLVKVKAFFDDNMSTAIHDLDFLEVKWQNVLRDGTLPGHAHTPLDVFKRTMKVDAGFCLGIENKLKTMETMS